MLGVVEVDLMIRLLRAESCILEHLTASVPFSGDCILYHFVLQA